MVFVSKEGFRLILPHVIKKFIVNSDYRYSILTCRKTITSVAFSGDGKYLATGEVSLYNLILRTFTKKVAILYPQCKF